MPTNKETERSALEIVKNDRSKKYLELNKKQKTNMMIAFAYRNMVVYGRAYDLIECIDSCDIDFDDIESIKHNITKIKLIEIKSSSRDMKNDLDGYFFALTTAELLVAQTLGEQYSFLFVNIKTNTIKEMNLQEVFARSKGFYPSWSVRF
jgi:hypothetical protein